MLAIKECLNVLNKCLEMVYLFTSVAFDIFLLICPLEAVLAGSISMVEPHTIMALMASSAGRM